MNVWPAGRPEYVLAVLWWCLPGQARYLVTLLCWRYLLFTEEERGEHRRCQLLDGDWECDCHQLLQSLTDSQTDNTSHRHAMCLSRAPDKINYQETDGIMEEISGSDHPSTEQFNMLLNLLPAHTLQQVRDMDSLRYLTSQRPTDISKQ